MEGREKLLVTCRPAREADTADMLELTRNIWEGHDYVPQAWADWLADREGLLAVAEADGRVLGLSKITRLSAEQWWLEGLRVDPEYEGRGIASQLHDYQVGRWDRLESGVIRLATASFRPAVHHLAERSGFVKVGEFSTFGCPSLPGPAEEFQPVVQEEAAEALAFVRANPGLQLSAGLMDLGWQWAAPEMAFLAEPVGRGWAWWWRGREGFLAAREDEEEENGTLFASIQVAACHPDRLADFLLDFRSLAGSLGYTKIGWMAPLHPQVLQALHAAGFRREWEDSIFLFAKTSQAGASADQDKAEQGT